MNSKLKTKNERKWENHCKELIKFRKNNPDRWPSALKKEEQELAFWLVNCKTWYNGNRSPYGYGPFPQNRYEQLKNIGYDLKVTKTEKQQQTWDNKFHELKKGLQIYGDTYQTKFFVKWLSAQRQKYKNGKLSAERIEKLKSIGSFLEKLSYSEIWDKNYAKLEKYLNDHNGILFYSVNGRSDPLYRWLHGQKHKSKYNKLSQEQIKKLQYIETLIKKPIKPNNSGKLGRSIRSDIWDKNFEKLEKYLTDNNGILKDIINGKRSPLYRWFYAQKRKYRHNKLSPEQAEKLKSLKIQHKGSLDKIKYSDIWDKNFEKLEKSLNNNNGILKNTINGKRNPLYTWLDVQKHKYKHNKLSQEQIKKLLSLKVQRENLLTESKFLDIWDKNFEKLKKYLTDNNGIIKDTINGKSNPVYAWLHAQKDKYKHNKLSQEQIEKLISIGVPVKDWTIEIYD